MKLTREQILGWKANNGAMSPNEFMALCDLALRTFALSESKRTFTPAESVAFHTLLQGEGEAYEGPTFDCHYDGDINRCDKDCKQIGECKRRTTGVPSAGVQTFAVAPPINGQTGELTKSLTAGAAPSSSEVECSNCRRLENRIEKIDRALDEAGAPVNGDWDGMNVALSQVGRIKRLASVAPSASVPIWQRRFEWLLHNCGLVNEWAATEWKPGKDAPLMEYLERRINAAIGPTATEAGNG